MKKNIISIDFECGNNWEFFEEFKDLNDNWEVDKCVSNFSQKSKISIIKRYLKYFSHSFSLFLKRKKIEKLVAWQQFYGIIFCWLMAFFRVKSVTKVTILTFIFKEKNGFKGKIYKRFISKALQYKGLENIVVLSKYEVDKYSQIFVEAKEKFIFTKLGISSKKIDYKKEKSEEYVLSAGRSNRDYNFLIKVFKRIPNVKCKIVCDNFNCDNLPSNIELLDNVFGENYYKMIIDSKFSFIPLCDEPISSGQLAVLDSHKYNKITVVTDNPGINDYIIEGINGYIVKKDSKEVAKLIENIYNNENQAFACTPYLESDYAKCVVNIIYKKGE